MEGVTWLRLRHTSAGESFQPKVGQLDVCTPGSTASVLIFCGPPASFKGYGCRLCTSHKGNMKVKGEDRPRTVLYPQPPWLDSLKVWPGVLRRLAPGCLQPHADPSVWEGHLACAIPLGSCSDLTVPFPQPSLHP